jgi:hypothetical protein
MLDRLQQRWKATGCRQLGAALKSTLREQHRFIDLAAMQDLGGHIGFRFRHLTVYESVAHATER